MSDFDFLQEPEIKRFIQENVNTDVNKLLLNPPLQIARFSKQVASQILSRQKARRKLDSWVSNFDLVLPPPISIEQASSEQTAQYKKSILKGRQLIDLTGGTGVDTLALQDGFEKTTYIEQQQHLVDVFRHNCKVLDKHVDVICGSAESFLESISPAKRYSTTFFLDPARRDQSKKKVFNLEDCSPNIVELQSLLKEKGSRSLIKLSPFLDIKSILKKVENIREVHVVSVKNECKELLILIDPEHDKEPEVRTVNIDRTDQYYNFRFSEEAVAQSQFELLKKYILEPNASILKAGAFNKVAVDFGVKKVHPNTHLYTSDQQNPDWPGRTFEVAESKVDKITVDKYAQKGLINVIVRNYPLSTAELKKKFKVQDGGDYFLIGFKGADQKGNLVIARKI